MNDMVPDVLDEPMPPARPAVGAAFLLAQLGAHATARYAERVSELDLNPGQTGLLRLVASRPGLNQQTLAGLLGVTPSKVVALVDELAARGWVERRRSETDRRSVSLHLTGGGRTEMAAIRAVAVAHERAVTSSLTESERDQLIGLLQKVADHQGLTPGVHPGHAR